MLEVSSGARSGTLQIGQLHCHVALLLSNFITPQLQSTLGQLDYSALTNHTVVVLRRRDDVYRRVLHTTCALLGVGLAVYRFYRQ